MGAQTGIYVGADPLLQGKSAIVLPGLDAGQLRAQFDDLDLVRWNQVGVGMFQAEYLGYGWHTFPIAEWDVRPHSFTARWLGQRDYQEQIRRRPWGTLS